MTAKKHSDFFFGFTLILVLFLGAYSASAGQPDGLAHFKKGKLDLDSGRNGEAVQNLLAAREESPLLGDYAALYLADAYHRAGAHASALEAVQGLLKDYPGSPLVKRARAAELREAKEAREGALRGLYEAYIRDYPYDDETTMAYALYLKQNGEAAKAVPIFRNLYVGAGSAASSALAELSPGEISASDLVERAGNLMKRYNFREAEKELRKALHLDDGRQREDILRNLGQALFRQKEYKEAATVYGEANDFYSKARSLYRSGDKEGFDKDLAALVEKKDKRAGGLLLASASDLRRSGDFEAALKVYKDVLAKFPAEEEDALWGAGWTLYVTEDYQKAADTFKQLFTKYEDPKYRYWQARSVESLGGDAGELYRSISAVDNNYYAFMAQLKSGGRVVPASYVDAASAPTAEGLQWRNRVEALIGLGMQKEAAFELTCKVKNIDSQSDLLYAVSKLYELGDFRKAVSLATKMPYSERMYRLWYPLAFWDEVSSVTRKHGFDPMLALSVMREESRFDAGARSVAGARGLMQLMPQTAFRLDKSLNLGISRESEIHDVRNNISLGVYYLKSLFSEFSSMSHAIAAYNAGEAAVRRWEREGRSRTADEFIEEIPYAETRNYVKKVLTSYFQYRKFYPAGSGDLMLGKL